MPTLKETKIELSDCHTTLYYFGVSKPNPAPLPLGTEESYVKLYETVAAPMRITYDDVSGQAGVILEKLSPAYHKNKYWETFFAGVPYEAYAQNAWQFVLPIVCSLKTRIEFIPDKEFNFAVRPIPRVVLYPFGWSAWLSLRLMGSHTLDQLASFSASLFTRRCFRLDPDPAPLDEQPSAYSVRDFFRHVAAGVRADAFGGMKTLSFGPQEPVSVTTVLVKEGGRPALGGLLGDLPNVLLRLAKPEGPPSGGDLEDHVHRLYDEDDTTYVVMEKYGRFTWMERQLKNPVGQNYAHLRCYHNNTFNSLLHARHLYQLLTQAARLEKLTEPLSTLTKLASFYLSSASLYYENASLREFLRDAAVADAKKKIAELNKKPADSL
jgi:hypothetical protein